MNRYDVLIIGAGHAGIEAAMASARMGSRTLMVTFKKDTIGLMSCNPAIGGVGKGQLVKEIDALGGQMGLAADACGIQFRILNASKGAAVQSTRAQIDMERYRSYMQELVAGQENLEIKIGQVKSLLVDALGVRGVIMQDGSEIGASCVVIATGTFLNGLIHVGMQHHSGGRIGEESSIGLDDCLRQLGFATLRFKTGTCPRLDKNSIDYSRMIVQEGDACIRPFSFRTENVLLPQVPCHITHTNASTHSIIRDNLDKSPLYAGKIKATGVRYCPSIEDKIVKFADKPRHQIFVEPQGLDTDLVYLNGVSTSLPEEIQLQIVHSVEGLEEARIVRFGYGIEHTVVEPTQLYPWLETKRIAGLFLAGQVNGTTGYEEAAAQGLIAGINAALRVQRKGPLLLDRASGYIGVLLDDLTTKGTLEPYRMFTSRVEYRLILREDNADLRLSSIGHSLGLIGEDAHKKVEDKRSALIQGRRILASMRLKPSEALNGALESYGSSPVKKALTLEEALKRPEMDMCKVMGLPGASCAIPEYAWRQLEIEVKYAGFIERQLSEVSRFKNLEKIKLPAGLAYGSIASLSREIREKLERLRPLNLGQASRISGVTPAAVSLLMVYLRKISHE